MELKDNKFNNLSTVNEEYEGEKWVETSWGKPGYPYQFKFEKSGEKISWMYFYPDAKLVNNDSRPGVAGRPNFSQLDNGQLRAIEEKIFGQSEKHDGKITAAKEELVNYLNTLAERTIGIHPYNLASIF